MEEKIEKTANASLSDFIAGEQTPVTQPVQPVAPQPVQPVAPQPVQPVAQTQPVQDGVQVPVAPVGVQPTNQPVQQIPNVTANVPEMIDPDKIIVGEGDESDGTKNRLSEDDVELIKWGDAELRVSKKSYEIKEVSEQVDLMIKKASNHDYKVSKKGTEYIDTRLEITYKDSDYKSSLPKIFWFKDKYILNKWNPSIKLVTTEKEAQSQFTSIVSKLYYKYITQFGIKELGRKEFLKQLVGKRVKLVEYVGEYEGKEFRRLDIFSFV